MTTKKNKVPKSTKTKLSDLTPNKDARGGRFATPPGGGAAGAGPGGTPPGIGQPNKKYSNRPAGGPATA
jgi:hypothetical protein